MTLSVKTLAQSLRRLFGHDRLPSEQDYRTFEKSCVHYLRSRGWRFGRGEMFEYWADSTKRRVFILFFPALRTITETHLIDWHQIKIRVGRPTYIICQDRPHEAYIQLGAERGLIIRHYLDIAILDPDIEGSEVKAAALRDGARAR